MQLLGAEKALFRHLKSAKDRPPKFGVIFAHPLIMNAQKNEKGKMARLLAAKLVMAARADFYTGNDMSEKLLADLDKKTAQQAAQGKPAEAERKPEEQRQLPEKRYGRLKAQERHLGKEAGMPHERRVEGQEGRPQFRERRAGRDLGSPQERRGDYVRIPDRQPHRPQFAERRERPAFGRRDGRRESYGDGRPRFPQRNEGRDFGRPERSEGGDRPFRRYGQDDGRQDRPRFTGRREGSGFVRRERSDGGFGGQERREGGYGGGHSRFSGNRSFGQGRLQDRRGSFGGGRSRAPGRSFSQDRSKPKYRPQRKRHDSR
jgi:hypothetical protein